DAHVSVRIGADKVFSIQAQKLGLLELLPNPRSSSYWFRAEVRHDDYFRPGAGEVGIYFAHSQFSNSQGERAHFFATLSYDDLTNQAAHFPRQPVKGNPVDLCLQSRREPERPPEGARYAIARFRFTPSVADSRLPAPAPWRPLSI